MFHNLERTLNLFKIVYNLLDPRCLACPYSLHFFNKIFLVIVF
jgi:hypothetical protein